MDVCKGVGGRGGWEGGSTIVLISCYKLLQLVNTSQCHSFQQGSSSYTSKSSTTATLHLPLPFLPLGVSARRQPAVLGLQAHNAALNALKHDATNMTARVRLGLASCKQMVVVVHSDCTNPGACFPACVLSRRTMLL